MKSETSFQAVFRKEHRKNSLKNIVFPRESVFTAIAKILQGHLTAQRAQGALSILSFIALVCSSPETEYWRRTKRLTSGAISIDEGRSDEDIVKYRTRKRAKSGILSHCHLQIEQLQVSKFNQKIPPEKDVAPKYKLLTHCKTLFTLFPLFSLVSLITLFTLLTLLSLSLSLILFALLSLMYWAMLGCTGLY